MKKIIPLLALCLGSTALVQAQTERDIDESKSVILGPSKKSGGSTSGSKDVVLGRDGRVYNDSRTRYPSSYPTNSRSAEINRINRDYDAKIRSIRNNRLLSNSEKERTIRTLEADRERRIRQVNDQYSSNRNNDRRYDDDRYDDRRYDNDHDNYKKNKKYKKNNGNHYGWQKGKGNPHRGRH